MKHPNAKWTECVKEGAKMYRLVKKWFYIYYHK
jgi:hypothetical protein